MKHKPNTLGLKLVVLLVLLGLMSPLSAQLIYKLNTKKTSYLLVCSPTTSSDFFIQLKPIFKIYNEAEVVVSQACETDSSTQQLMMDHAMMKTSLIHYLNDTQTQTIDSLTQSLLQLSLSELSMLEPSMLSQMLVEALRQKLYPLQDLNQTYTANYFPYVAQQIDHKPVIGLSSIEDIIHKIKQNQTIAQQNETLIQLCNDQEAMATFITQAHEAYLAQDMETLDSLYTHTPLRFYNQQINEKTRNERWGEKIKTLGTDHRLLVVINVEDAVGQEGLLEILKAQKLLSK